MNDLSYELSTGASFFYGGGPYMHVRVVLKEAVNASVLQDAADLTMKRFPYFAVRVAVGDKQDRYVLEHNDAPFLVQERNCFLTKEDEGVNGYLISVACYGTCVFFSSFHGLTDGGSLRKYAQAFLHAYFELLDETRHPCTFSPNVHEQAAEDEYSDPYSYLRTPESVYPRIIYKDAFSFSPEDIDESSTRLYKFSVPEGVLAEYAKAFEGSFSGALSVAMARSIDILTLEDTRPILIACPMDVRRILGCTNTMQNCTKGMLFCYSNRVKKRSFLEHLSILKGQSFIQSSEEYVLPILLGDREYLNKVYLAPTIEEKMSFYTETPLYAPPVVSYIGTFDLRVRSAQSRIQGNRYAQIGRKERVSGED